MQLFEWTTWSYLELAGVLIFFIAGIAFSLSQARKNRALQGYPIIFAAVILMLPFVLMFVGLHLFWVQGFSQLPDFIHVFYDRTIDLQRGNLVWFTAHACLGMTLWLFWLVQFHPRFRARYIKWHRLVGRLYFLTLAPFLITALYIMNFTPGNSMTWKALISIQVVLTVMTAGFAYRAIRRRDFAGHQMWMIRNAAVMIQTFLMRLFLMFMTLFTQDVGDALSAAHALGFICSLCFFHWYFEPRFAMYAQKTAKPIEPTLVSNSRVKSS